MQQIQDCTLMCVVLLDYIIIADCGFYAGLRLINWTSILVYWCRYVCYSCKRTLLAAMCAVVVTSSQGCS